MKLTRVIALAGLSMLAAKQADAAVNLVTNGGFETNAGVGQLGSGGATTVSGWTTGSPTNSPSPTPYNFVLTASAADSQGFSSIYSPPSIYVWGPSVPPPAGGPSNNGFTGSPDGGFFFGSDGGYAAATMSQTITGLTVGNQYQLSFQYAGSQFTDSTGATAQDWQVTLGSDTYTTPTLNVPSKGFSGWQTYSTTVTATATSENLSFLAQGAPAFQSPFALLDGVSLTAVSVPEPVSSGLLGIAAVSLLARRRRPGNARI